MPSTFELEGFRKGASYPFSTNFRKFKLLKKGNCINLIPPNVI